MPDQFDEWLDSGLVLPIGGHEFRVESPSALTVLTLHHRRETQSVTEGTEREDIRLILGDTWQHMIDAEVAELSAYHAGRTALVHYLNSADAAIDVWTFTPPTVAEEPEPQQKRGPSIKGVDPDDSVDPPGTINDYDPGGGPYIPEMGIRMWAYPMEFAPAYSDQIADDHERAEWLDIFAAWECLELDFAHILHLDLTPDLLADRPWRWFAVRLSRILGDRDTLASRFISAQKAGDDE